MNILLLERDLSCRGGCETMAFAVTRGLAERGHTIFLAHEVTSTLVDENCSIFQDIKTVRLQPFGWRKLLQSLLTAWTIRRLVKLWKIDVVFTTHRGFLRTLALLNVISNVPFVYRLALGPPDKGGSNTWAIRKMNAGISPSKTNGEEWVVAGLPREKLYVVPNWIDFERFKPCPDKMKQRHELGLNGSATMIVYVGRVVPEKGVEILLRAFADLSSKRGKMILVVVGGVTQDYAKQLAALCERLGLSKEQVRMAGASREPERYYAAADVAVVPSLALETFGLTAIEAMACGALTIVSSAGELPFNMGVENQDLVFRTGDASELARLLADWTRSQQAASERGLKLRDFAKSHFQMHGKIDHYETIINSVVRRKQTPTQAGK